MLFDPLLPGDGLGKLLSTPALNALRSAGVAAQDVFRAVSPPQPQTPQGSVVRVQNNSGGNLSRFSVLGIDGPVISATTNLEEFKAGVVLSGITPTSDHESGKFVILLEDLRDGYSGYAWVAGVAIVQVNVTNTAHAFAEAASGDSAKLTSASRGSAEILHVQSGTGTKWAIIRFGGRGASALQNAEFECYNDEPTSRQTSASTTRVPIAFDVERLNVGGIWTLSSSELTINYTGKVKYALTCGFFVSSPTGLNGAAFGVEKYDGVSAYNLLSDPSQWHATLHNNSNAIEFHTGRGVLDVTSGDKFRAFFARSFGSDTIGLEAILPASSPVGATWYLEVA